MVADALSRRSMESLTRLCVIERPIVKEAQQIARQGEGVLSGKIKNFALDENGVIRLDGRLCVPNVEVLRRAIMIEDHNFRYSIHPGSTKIYHDLMDVYWWNNMKRDIADYVLRYLNCLQVKAEHQRPSGLAQVIEIPEWK
ncbi:uncharacterized protein [Nicotiana tomentosiformis]|uniref:uncharacterized protein n=1 Tax=Nicotiana tomentosiformis TaxID=4098 RepID=UPI00051C77CF|nr:uncharacterized protein LOC104105027 [Nicotiana tomentosiformis]